MDESSGPQGRSLLDTLNISDSGLPVELLSASASTSNPRRNPFFPSNPQTQTTSSSSLFQFEEATSSRRSGRAIKRKKFDDELLTSATLPMFNAMSPPPPLATQAPSISGSGSQLSPSLPPPPSSTTTSSSLANHPSPSSPSPHSSISTFFGSGPFSQPGRNTSGSNLNLSKVGKGVGKKGGKKGFGNFETRSAALKKLKQQKKKKPRKDEAWKDLGRWKPVDDLALITAVLQTNDLSSVHKGVKFSCHFTFSEVELRWKALMYNPVISKLALQAVRNLPPEIVLTVQRKTLLSQQEKDLLGTVKSNKTPAPTLNDFSQLLAAHPGVFHFARTPECLKRYWQALRQYTLLPDQSVQPLPRDNHILNFLDAETSILDSELTEPRDEFLYHELAVGDRKSKREIRHLEAEVQKWQVLVDTVRGDNPPDFDSQTLAVLRGRLVRYLMRSREITLGRSTKDQSVDVDLKLEGPAWKISRKQGVIKLKTSGEFYIANEGKRNFFVDGKPILRGNRVRLNNNSVLEIAGLKFVFLINQDLIEALRQESSRLYQNS